MHFIISLNQELGLKSQENLSKSQDIFLSLICGNPEITVSCNLFMYSSIDCRELKKIVSKIEIKHIKSIPKVYDFFI